MKFKEHWIKTMLPTGREVEAEDEKDLAEHVDGSLQDSGYVHGQREYSEKTGRRTIWLKEEDK